MTTESIMHQTNVPKGMRNDINFSAAGTLILTWYNDELHCILRMNHKLNFGVCWNFIGGKKKQNEYASETASRQFQNQTNFYFQKDTILSILSSNSYPLFLQQFNYWLFVTFVDMSEHFHASGKYFELIPWGTICRDKYHQGISLSEFASCVLDEYNLHQIVKRFLKNNGFVDRTPLTYISERKQN